MSDSERRDNSSETRRSGEFGPIIQRHVSGKTTGPNIISMISGKGGTGQSMICANIGVYLAQTGKRVLVVDAKRWGQNLHTFLGLPAPKLTLDSLAEKRVESIEELLVETPFQKLKLLCGMKEAPAQTASLSCPFLVEEGRKLAFDFILLDLGSTLSFNVLDHAIWSDSAILTTLPEPTAIENTYELLRSLYFRLFKTMEESLGIQEIVEKTILNGRELGIRSPRDLVGAVKFFDPEMGDRMAHEVGRFHLSLLLNKVRASGEYDLGEGIVSACRRYFGFNVAFLGALEYDSAAPASVRRRSPLHTVQKDAKVTEQLERVTHKLMSMNIKSKQDD